MNNLKCTLKIFIFSFILTQLITLNAKHQELVIIGGGITGGIEALTAHREALKNNINLCITIYEKNQQLQESTSCNIVPSLTPDEILSVIPRGTQLIEKLQIVFSLPGGIRIDDVPGIYNSYAAEHFQQEALQYSLDEQAHHQRTEALLQLGKLSMNFWQEIYESSDEQLQKILRDANFNPCKEPNSTQEKELHNGYRIDIIYGVDNAILRANSMKADYEKLGYKHCAVLTAKEVIQIDPFLTEFCFDHSHLNAENVLEWNQDTVALWRPGGCLDSSVFLPKLYTYLEKNMGTYVDEHGIKKSRFQIHFNRTVQQLQFGKNDHQETVITGIQFTNGQIVNYKPENNTEFVLCPGEAIGTLKKLGLQEPAYGGFAGPSLLLNINIPEQNLNDYRSFSHCMEVHQEGIVLAWQARTKNNQLFIGVGGTKAFYADQTPHKDQAFARNRNLLQLNIINNVMPQCISWAIGRETKGQTLTAIDLQYLEDQNIAQRWVGTRAVAYDGFPTLGYVYTETSKVVNARCTTHLGSGGVSFAPAAVWASRNAMNPQATSNDFLNQILSYSCSARKA